MRAPASTSLIACLLAIAAPGCGSDEQPAQPAQGGGETPPRQTGTQPQAEAGSRLSVELADFAIEPQDARVEQAGPVTVSVRSNGQAPHALEIEGPAGEFVSETLQAGGRTTLRADLSEPGEYVWYCPVGNHRDQGMEGTLTVGSGAGGGSPDDGGSGDDGGGSGGGTPGY